MKKSFRRTLHYFIDILWGFRRILKILIRSIISKDNEISPEPTEEDLNDAESLTVEYTFTISFSKTRSVKEENHP